MHRRIAHTTLALILVALTGLAVVAPYAVSAQAEQVLSIWPVRHEHEAKPGETVQGVVNVMNRGSEDRTVYALAMDFEAGGEGGQPRFIDTPAEGSSHSLASWITIVGEPIVIAPGEIVEVPFSISVPQDAEPGGHYAGILVGRFSPETLEGEGTAVTVGSVAASLVLLTVPGNIIEEGAIAEFRTSRGFYEHLSVDLYLSFENTGNVHMKPQGIIEIYDWRNNKKGEVAVNGEGGNVLPNSLRRFEASWSDGWGFGRYKAVATISYGTENTELTSEVYFWVIPWKTIIAVVAGLLALGIGLWQLRKRLRFRVERK
ncbi:MAG: hypothetical protein ISS53_01565 [Dehalococcoidia bacterium]|nr:hypothetical protein [Dehalococcoidia bacterium]